MPRAEVITIGTELLLGEIVDTNTQEVVRTLRQVGVDVYRTTTVGDNVPRIAAAMKESLSRADIVITTGGLGPTVDDPTRQAVAQAVSAELVFREDLWQQIQDRLHEFHREVTENNKRQAYVPRGAMVLENERGTAPAFILEDPRGTLVALPGVPPEMRYLLENKVLPWLKHRYALKHVILSKNIKTTGAGESKIDDVIADFERLENPTVGLSAHKGSVDVRITAKAGSPEEAQALIKDVENKLRERLSPWIPAEN